MTNLGSRITRKINRILVAHLGQHKLALKAGKGIVSFTFDDAPASACQVGAEILERYSAHGSFYVCGGLTDGIEQQQTCHSVADLLRLQAAGHEIACHTFSHMNCANYSVLAVQADWQKNQKFFAQHGLHSAGFAFPFGAVSWRAKLAAKSVFRYARITGGGAQLGSVDVYALRAQALYANKTSLDLVQNLIAQVAQGGWLIFYTHGVRSEAGAWDATPELFEFAVQTAHAQGCAVLSVSEALAQIQRDQ